MKHLSFTAFLLVGASAFCQDVGLEMRAYTAGQMFLLSGEYPIKSRSALLVDFGYNRADRKDFGVHDNEEGGGFGSGVGYRYFLKEQQRGFFLGIENFFWKLSIDWQSTGGNLFTSTGTSEILVIQPALNGDYKYVSESGKYFGEVGLAFGREYNVKTVGAEVGQGGISMILVGFGVRL